jgi:ribosomal protein S27E
VGSTTLGVTGKPIMSKRQDPPKPLTVRCPNCKQTREPDFNETTKRYVCSICGEPVDAQVFIEKRKRGEK